jgi:hypothetical protein
MEPGSNPLFNGNPVFIDGQRILSDLGPAETTAYHDPSTASEYSNIISSFIRNTRSCSDMVSFGETHWKRSFQGIYREKAREIINSILKSSEANFEYRKEVRDNGSEPGTGFTFAFTADLDCLNDQILFVEELMESLESPRVASRNALVQLVSSAEWLMSDLLHQQFKRHPYSGISKDAMRAATYSLEDLKHFNSFEDILEDRINSRVEQLMRDSMENLLGFVQSKFKIKVSSNELPLILETFQRRNIVVHNQGIVNKIYLAKVPTEFQTQRVGDPVPLGAEYVDSGVVGSCRSAN